MFRNPMHLGRWMAIAVAIGLVCSSQALAKKPDNLPSDPAYTIVPFLAPDPPLDFQSVRSSVGGVNDVGYAVGVEDFEKELPDGSFQTVRWVLHLDMATWTYTQLQAPNGSYYPTCVNNLNQIVGEGGASGAVFWKGLDAAPVDLPLLPGDTGGCAYAINDAGIIVGILENDESPRRGVVWRVLVDENGDVSFIDGPVPLPPLDGDRRTGGFDLTELIDGSFQVSGTSHGGGRSEAVVWTIGVNPDGTLAAPAAPVGLGTLGIYDPSSSHGNAINVFGDVCGFSDGMPYVAPAGQTAQPLPVTRNAYEGHAWDINDVGEIVGWLGIEIKGWHYTYDAYLWKDGDVINLQTQIDRKSGWGTLWGAHHINNAGVIAGRGYFDVESRGFLLIPNEP